MRSIIKTAVLIAVGIAAGCGILKYTEYRKRSHPVQFTYLSQASKFFDPQGNGVAGHITLDLVCTQPLTMPPYLGQSLRYGRIWFDVNIKTGRLYPVKVELPTDQSWRCPAPISATTPTVSK